MVISKNKEVKQIYYKSKRTRLGYLGNKLIFKDLDIADNLLPLKALNMQNWSINKANYASTFTNWSFNDDRTSFNFRGTSGWEIIYFPITVKPNTNYTWQWNFTKFNNLTSGDNTIRKLNCAILNIQPTTDYSFNTSMNTINYSGHALAYVDVQFNADSINQNDEGLYTYISFNSGNNTQLYIAYNFGFVYDSQTWDITIARQMLSEGLNPKIFAKPNQ